MTPEQRAKHREEQRRYRERIKADPARLAAFKAKKRDEDARRNRDPVKLAKKLATERATYARQKVAAPDAHEAFLATVRASYQRRRDDPEFRARLKRARIKTRRKQRRHDARDLVARVMKALPAGLPPYMRDDVAQDMLAAIAARRLKRADIEARVKDFIRAYNRQFDSFKTLSLDAPVPGMDGVNFIDLLPSEASP